MKAWAQSACGLRHCVLEKATDQQLESPSAEVWLALGLPEGFPVIVARDDYSAVELLGVIVCAFAQYRSPPQAPLAMQLRRTLLILPQLDQPLQGILGALAGRGFNVPILIAQGFEDERGEFYLTCEGPRIPEPPPSQGSPPITREAVHDLLRAAVLRMSHEVGNKTMAILGTAQGLLLSRAPSLDEAARGDLQIIVDLVGDIKSALQRYKDVRQFTVDERYGVPLVDLSGENGATHAG